MQQKIVRGIDCIRDVLQESKRVLLVCDNSFPFLCIKDDIENIGVPYVIFNQYTPNPIYQDVCKGVDLFQEERCDTILAVGGGSSLDVAKCIKLFCKMERDTLFLEQAYYDTGVKLIAIPTTAGTGSESTCYAVIYYDGKKQSVTHESIIPDVAILEPKVLKTLPIYQKKCTMMDALCQGIESWWSINSTEESKVFSRKTVELIMANWNKYIFENDEESAAQIMLAANYGGRAINITQTTAAHAFSYKLTSLYKIPHGHAVAVGLPGIWEYMIMNPGKCIDGRGQEYLAGILHDIARAMGCDTPIVAVALFRKMMLEMDLKYPVSANKAEELEILSSSVNPLRLKNNPIELNTSAIRSLYESIVKSHS